MLMVLPLTLKASGMEPMGFRPGLPPKLKKAPTPKIAAMIARMILEALLEPALFWNRMNDGMYILRGPWTHATNGSREATGGGPDGEVRTAPTSTPARRCRLAAQFGIHHNANGGCRVVRGATGPPRSGGERRSRRSGTE